jgi:hypothetical protein
VAVVCDAPATTAVGISDWLPSVAVTVAWSFTVIVDVEALKDAVVAPAAIVTEAGTVRDVRLLDRPTVMAEAADLFNATTQLLELLLDKVDGTHTKDVS